MDWNRKKQTETEKNCQSSLAKFSQVFFLSFKKFGQVQPGLGKFNQVKQSSTKFSQV